MKNWKPIHTAPKDGTRILLYRSEWMENVCVGFWDSVWKDWRVVGGGSPWLGATHWTDIPALPKSKMDLLIKGSTNE